MTDESTTERLFETARRGDPAAFEGLIDRFTPPLVVFIRERGGRGLSADFGEDDVFQTVAGEVWRLMSGLEWRGERAFQGLLVKLARQALGHRVRYHEAKGGRAVRHLESDQREGGGRPPLAPATALSSLIRRRDEAERLHEVIRALDEDDRDLVIAYYVEGRSMADIAERIGRSKGAVFARVHRVLADMRSALVDAPRPPA